MSNNLIEQCFAQEEQDKLYSNWAYMNFIRDMVELMINNLNKPSILRQMFIVEKV